MSALLERGWRWTTVPLHGHQGLALRSPRGVIWQFKLGGGAWLRRIERNNA